jgi:serine phosphatase RsbU (regulator of sigma subunit)
MHELLKDDVDNALNDPALVEQLRLEVDSVRRELAHERSQAESQLRIASQVHQSLLPSPIRHSQLDVDVRYLPIDTVGGDYCQVRFPDPSSCYITMCDVAGHGIGPSLLAARVSSEVRRLIKGCLPPHKIVQTLSDFIHEYFLGTGLLLSFVATRIDLSEKTITYSGAGHPPILHLRPGVGLVAPLVSQNMVIGVTRDCLSDEPEQTQLLEAGDRLVFYTDGITEAANSRGRLLGTNGLVDIASRAMSLDPSEMSDGILDETAKFRFGAPTDDMTVIVVEMK